MFATLQFSISMLIAYVIIFKNKNKTKHTKLKKMK